MPKATFTGIRLSLVGDIAVTVSYPDTISMETFMKMKEACDAVLSPPLALDETSTERKSNNNK